MHYAHGLILTIFFVPSRPWQLSSLPPIGNCDEGGRGKQLSSNRSAVCRLFAVVWMIT